MQDLLYITFFPTTEGELKEHEHSQKLKDAQIHTVSDNNSIRIFFQTLINNLMTD